MILSSAGSSHLSARSWQATFCINRISLKGRWRGNKERNVEIRAKSLRSLIEMLSGSGNGNSYTASAFLDHVSFAFQKGKDLVCAACFSLAGKPKTFTFFPPLPQTSQTYSRYSLRFQTNQSAMCLAPSSSHNCSNGANCKLSGARTLH